MMLTTPEIARMLRVTVPCVGKYCARGVLKAVNLNPHGKIATWRVPVEEVEKLTGMKVDFSTGEARLVSV